MNSESPLISVVIPAYNCEDSIGSTLNSVLQQTYITIEVIVINDGSTDETLTVLKSFQDSRLQIVTQPNSGVSATRNRGINLAKGDFIAFLDSDDLWLPNKLSDQIIALQSNSQAAIAYSWTDYIDQSGHFLRQGYYCHFEGNVHRRLLLGSFLESGSNPLIRRMALEAVGGFDESLRTCEDWDLWIRLALKYEFVVVPQVHVQYRVVTNSKSFLLDKHEAGGLSVINKAFSQLPEEHQALKSKASSNFYKYLLFKLLDAPQPAPVDGQRNAQRAFRYLRLSIYHHPQLLRQVKVILSALAKILAISVQPFYRSTNV